MHIKILKQIPSSFSHPCNKFFSLISVYWIGRGILSFLSPPFVLISMITSWYQKQYITVKSRNSTNSKRHSSVNLKKKIIKSNYGKYLEADNYTFWTIDKNVILKTQQNAGIVTISSLQRLYFYSPQKKKKSNNHKSVPRKTELKP